MNGLGWVENEEKKTKKSTNESTKCETKQNDKHSSLSKCCDMLKGGEIFRMEERYEAKQNYHQK